ncbi:MAG: nucleotidyltransferase [Spirosomataceae bacterium]
MPATVFYRKYQSEVQQITQQRQQALARNAGQQLWFMFELVAISLRLTGGRLSLSDSKRHILNAKSQISVDLFQQDIIHFFKAMVTRNCRFLLVGGFAVNAHGYSRATGDLDLWLEETLENRHRLVEAAQDCGIAGAEHLLTMEFVPGWSGFALESGFEVELMSYIAGFEADDFNACYQHAKIVDFEQIPLRVLQLEDLIKAKEAINRDKDQEDIRQLNEIRKFST